MSHFPIAILGRVIQPDGGDLAPEAARSILKLGFPDADQDRMARLAERAAAGTLAADEADELDAYREVGHILAMMHSKARVSLKRAGLPT